MTVKALKLVSGEDIIAEIVNGDTSLLVLKQTPAKSWKHGLSTA
jgi:hypothetical protein